jgi:hypothetical protein
MIKLFRFRFYKGFRLIFQGPSLIMLQDKIFYREYKMLIFFKSGNDFFFSHLIIIIYEGSNYVSKRPM